MGWSHITQYNGQGFNRRQLGILRMYRLKGKSYIYARARTHTNNKSIVPPPLYEHHTTAGISRTLPTVEDKAALLSVPME